MFLTKRGVNIVQKFGSASKDKLKVKLDKRKIKEEGLIVSPLPSPKQVETPEDPKSLLVKQKRVVSNTDESSDTPVLRKAMKKTKYKKKLSVHVDKKPVQMIVIYHGTSMDLEIAKQIMTLDRLLQILLQM